jgi:serine-type D-Ala-D-Ala carboxypeptidase (penicillin-binding protein 5/6)
VAFALVRSLPGVTVTPVRKTVVFAGRGPRLVWPSQGQAALMLEGVGMIGSHGSQRPTPIASVAKVMTADVVLHDHPLHGGAGGPTLTVSPADVAAFRADQAAGDSVLRVTAGEHLTERQALEGLLLPSGNNVATLLAAWDAGSQRGFVAKMNARARALGLRHTRYTGASGVQASTVSTATDQVRVAIQTMAIPTFRQLVAMPQATLPVAGRVYNLDGLLGKDGIIGIKTGTTPQAGGCFVFAARAQAGNRRVTVVGAVFHQMASGSQPSIISAAFKATTKLLASTRGILERSRVIRRGATLAWVKTSWVGPLALRTARPVRLVGWAKLPVAVTLTTPPKPSLPLRTGQTFGSAVASAGTQHAATPLTLAGALPSASLRWRLTHP